MRKLTSILTVALMVISMTVCAQTAKGGKVLVAYFSASGNTKVAAEKIQKAAGADIYEIQPAKPYTKEDLDYRNRQSRSVAEMGNPAFREKLGGKPVDIKKYDVIYLGFPI
jgi:flavodoxin